MYIRSGFEQNLHGLDMAPDHCSLQSVIVIIVDIRAFCKARDHPFRIPMVGCRVKPSS